MNKKDFIKEAISYYIDFIVTNNTKNLNWIIMKLKYDFPNILGRNKQETDLEYHFNFLCTLSKHKSYSMFNIQLIKLINSSNKNISSIEGKIYTLLTNDNDYICSYNNIKKFKNLKIGYDTCGQASVCRCAGNKIKENIKLTKNKRVESSKKTCLERYGVDNPAKLQSSIDKAKATNIKKYGEITYSRTIECKQKVKDTNIKKYGVECTLQNSEIKKKAQDTIKKKYGVDNVMQVEEIKNKVKSTMEERYGVSDMFELARKSLYEKYPDVDNIFQDESIKERSKQTCLEKYGSEYYNQSLLPEEIKDILFNREILESLIKEKSPREIALEYNYNNFGIFYEYIKKYNIDYDYSRSSYERIIYNFLTDNNIPFIQNTRKIIPPKELDFYIESKKFAIEFNGTYWHREEIRDSFYHEDKILSCKKLDIELLMIPEDEWNKDSSYFKNYILKKCL